VTRVAPPSLDSSITPPSVSRPGPLRAEVVGLLRGHHERLAPADVEDRRHRLCVAGDRRIGAEQQVVAGAPTMRCHAAPVPAVCVHTSCRVSKPSRVDRSRLVDAEPGMAPGGEPRGVASGVAVDRDRESSRPPQRR
jgi:hypothetical protein